MSTIVVPSSYKLWTQCLKEWFKIILLDIMAWPYTADSVGLYGKAATLFEVSCIGDSWYFKDWWCLIVSLIRTAAPMGDAIGMIRKISFITGNIKIIFSVKCVSLTSNSSILFVWRKILVSSLCCCRPLAFHIAILKNEPIKELIFSL